MHKFVDFLIFFIFVAWAPKKNRKIYLLLFVFFNFIALLVIFAPTFFFFLEVDLS